MVGRFRVRILVESTTMPGVDDLTRARFRNGDRAAFEDVYRALSGAVGTVARSMLWSDDLVADAVQQTFVKVWRARRRYDPARPIAPWVYAIARRVTIDIVRRERRRAGPGLEGVDPVAESESFERVWERFHVRSAVDALPEDEREVVRLQHLEGWTHTQIAERLGIPVGTVKSRSHRAHGRLSEMLGFLVDEPDPSADRIEEGR